MFAMLRYLVGTFFDMFFTWLSDLIFFLWFQNLLMIIKTFFKIWNWSVFSLNTVLYFFRSQNWFVFSLNIDLIFFFVTKLIYFFLKYRSEFFSTTKQICIFIKYKFENFSEKFFFLKIVDFEISKNELRVRLKYFLNMWCMHNRFELWIWVLFCKSFFLPFTKNKSDFS